MTAPCALLSLFVLYGTGRAGGKTAQLNCLLSLVDSSLDSLASFGGERRESGGARSGCAITSAEVTNWSGIVTSLPVPDTLFKYIAETW